MRKIVLCNPLRPSNFGDTTRIVEIFSRLPKELDAQVYIFHEGDYKKILDIDNSKIVRLRSTIFGKRIRYLSRILSEFLIIYYSILISNLDLVYQIQTTFSFSGLLVSKIKKVPLIYEVNSLLEYEKDRTFFNNAIIKIAKKLEKQTVEQASKITVVTPEIKKIFHDEYSIPLDKFEVVPNGANLDLFYPMDKLKCREELNFAKDIFFVCFVGGLGLGCGAKNIVEAAPHILEQIPNTLFLIVGDGPYKAIMKEKIEFMHLQDYFIFTGAVPHETVPKYINSSDVCIAFFNDERIKKVGGGSCIKLYEYLACGKPVIGTVELSTFQILTEYNAGIVVNSDDLKNIADSIVNLIKNENLIAEMVVNGRKLVEKQYNWNVIGRQLAVICEGLVIKK